MKASGPDIALKNPDKAGELFMNTVIDYLKKNMNELGILTIELEDNARKEIPTRDDNIVFDLSRSRQLEGKKPYYMKFQFFPQRLSAYAKIHNNRKKMKKLLTEDYDIVYIITKYRDDIEPTTVYSYNLISLFNQSMEYINNHNNDPMIQTISYLRVNFQPIFTRIYLDLFKMFKLEEPVDDENLYYLDL